MRSSRGIKYISKNGSLTEKIDHLNSSVGRKFEANVRNCVRSCSVQEATPTTSLRCFAKIWLDSAVFPRHTFLTKPTSITGAELTTHCNSAHLFVTFSVKIKDLSVSTSSAVRRSVCFGGSFISRLSRKYQRAWSPSSSGMTV